MNGNDNINSFFFADRWLSRIKRKLGTCEKNPTYCSIDGRDNSLEFFNQAIHNWQLVPVKYHTWGKMILVFVEFYKEGRGMHVSWFIYNMFLFVFEYTSTLTGFKFTTFIVIGTDCLGRCKSIIQSSSWQLILCSKYNVYV